jgi:hypothetical protein
MKKKQEDYQTQIHGSFFSPCFSTEEEYENAYKESIFYVEKDFMKEYQKHLAALPHIASIAKSYVLNNFEKVTDWANLDVVIIHGPTGEWTEYYNNEKILPPVKEKEPSEKAKKFLELVSKKPRKESDFMKKWRDRMEDSNLLRHNPIHVIDKVVLDPSDGDFSITVNGKEHWWIQDEAVIIIADYIEKQKHEKETKDGSQN